MHKYFLVILSLLPYWNCCLTVEIGCSRRTFAGVLVVTVAGWLCRLAVDAIYTSHSCPIVARCLQIFSFCWGCITATFICRLLWTRLSIVAVELRLFPLRFQMSCSCSRFLPVAVVANALGVGGWYWSHCFWFESGAVRAEAIYSCVRLKVPWTGLCPLTFSSPGLVDR